MDWGFFNSAALLVYMHLFDEGCWVPVKIQE